jgi:hypothetical protein
MEDLVVGFVTELVQQTLALNRSSIAADKGSKVVFNVGRRTAPCAARVSFLLLLPVPGDCHLRCHLRCHLGLRLLATPASAHPHPALPATPTSATRT